VRCDCACRAPAELCRALAFGVMQLAGEATVKTHVKRILMKLGLRDRVQAVVSHTRRALVRTRHA
jgi:DNA-binding CsgD family transcriptional regulator